MFASVLGKTRHASIGIFNSKFFCCEQRLFLAPVKPVSSHLLCIWILPILQKPVHVLSLLYNPPQLYSDVLG